MAWFKVEYIADEHWREMVQAVLDMQENHEPIMDAAMLQRLPANGSLFGSRLAELYGLWCDCSSQAANLNYYCTQVHKEWRRTHAAEDISGVASDLGSSYDVDESLKELPEIANRYAPVVQQRCSANREVMEDLYAELEGKKSDDYFRFGISAIDNIVNGLPPTTLTTIGARTSNGKSVVLGQSALRCAFHYRRPVLFFSLEMSQRQMYRRWAASMSELPFSSANKDGIKDALSTIYKLEKDGLLHVFSGPRSIEQITAETMAFANRGSLGMVAVDYLQAVLPTKGRNENREQQVAHIASALKNLAATAQTPVLTAGQLNKSGEGDPHTSSFRESEGIGNYSNVVILLHPDAGSETTDIARVKVILDKNRDGGKGVMYISWNKPIFLMKDEPVRAFSEFASYGG